MKFSQKILLLPGLAFIAFLAFFVVGKNLADESAERIADIEDRYFRQLEISVLLEQFATETQHAFSLAIANDEEFDLENAEAARESFLARVDEGLAAPKLAHEELLSLRDAYVAYYDKAMAVARTALETPFAEYTDEDFREQLEARAQYTDLIAQLAEARVLNRQRIDEAFRFGRIRARQGGKALRLTALVTVALLLVLSVGVILSLVRPLRVITTGTEAIASGDLYQTIDYRSNDDLGRLADSFRKMQKSLIADIGRRKAIEAQLRTNEERLALAFEVANDGLWDHRIDTGDIYLSPRFFSLLGYDAGDLDPSFRTIATLTHPEEEDHIAEQFQRHLHEGVPFLEEMRLRCKDGSWRWFHVVGRIVEVDTEGKPTRTVGTVSDVTARKEAEQQLAAAQDELLESARGAGMAEIATSVLHNVGNVLNAATTSASVLAHTVTQSRLSSLRRLAEVVREREGDFADYVAKDPQGQKLPGFLVSLTDVLSAEHERLELEVERLAKSHEHIKEIIALQQNYAGISGATEDLHPRSLIDDALQLVGGSFERHHIDVTIEADAEVPRVRVETHLALQILVNLLKNARDAIKELHSQAPDLVTTERPAVAIAIRQKSEGYVTIEVTDSGIGIEPNLMDRIFAYGFTTKREGHGFGLHGAANAAREMGGSLEATSGGRGKGATFIYTLPVAGRRDATSSKDPKGAA
ncbi:MAG: PAS domain-containing protein [Candidatus Eisenbacteria bacterium]|uniref:histidine kinase n=1 Tax=Eiseniibacteriota bacterium TaxID=2212470 RepID=A0A956NHQ0_UNCEI|nr:PAS domain-containing protein [Candidatus Eisenbacteria bacterium]MCB9463316.1 PAS domain-containing protein [Candidatus Eisenbacteria bacterium]